MSDKALVPFERRLEDWRATHPSRWIATTDRTAAAEFISKQAQKIVSAQLESADRIIVSQERVADGIDKVVLGIARVADGLESLASAFDWGLSEMIWHLEQQRAVLIEILKVLQAPLDTQAKELRKRAEDAYRNGWIDDALEDFLESEKKNRYDFTVHQSLGNIYLFHKMDPDRALEYYEKAAKYATPQSPYHASLALLHMGLIHYLQADFEKTYQMTSQAIELSPDLCEAHYQHAQYCALLGKHDEAIDHLGKAVQGDKYYCLKADTEKDFDVMKQRLRPFFEDLRKQTEETARREVNKAHELIQDAESYGLSIHGEPASTIDKFRAAKKAESEAREFMRRASLFDCWDAIGEAHVAQGMAIDSSAEYLSDQIPKTQSERDKSMKSFRTMLYIVGIVDFLLACPICVLVLDFAEQLELLPKGNMCATTLALLAGYLLFCIVGFAVYRALMALRKAPYENRLATLRTKLSKVQTQRTQLRTPLKKLQNDQGNGANAPLWRHRQP